VAAGFAAGSAAGGDAARGLPDPLVAGVAAPPFAAPPLAGPPGAGARALADYRGEVVVLAFYATHCAGCHVVLPQLAELGREYAGRGLRVVAVNLDDPRGFDAADARGYVGHLGPGIEVLRDGTGGAGRAYSVWAVPSLFVLDRGGVIRGRSFGHGADKRVAWITPAGRALLDTLIARPAPPAAERGAAADERPQVVGRGAWHVRLASAPSRP
jgi:thiol-disulfide isomerase/thioredoxin